jgi:hypothetical protein
MLQGNKKFDAPNLFTGLILVNKLMFLIKVGTLHLTHFISEHHIHLRA